MKTSSFLLVAAGLAAAVVAFGCSPPPPPPPQPPPPPPPAVAAPEKPSFVGLPLTGSQIDVLGNIEFDTDKATIRQTPQTLGILTTLATAGKMYPQITKLRVEGHTDGDGDEGHNQDLSEQRAQAVVKWLVDNGIDASRLTAAGCGSRDPLVPNTSAENKQKNRRTEFDIEEALGKPFEFATAPCAPNPSRKTE
jgi:outer membrane protein OmpA-like peptidoglycan-associated protein